MGAVTRDDGNGRAGTQVEPTPGTHPRLSGKIALITGAGRGLGAALANTLAQAGAIVVAADVHEDWAEQTARGLRDAGWEAMPLALDVRDAEGAQQALERAIERWGGLDILINNAGVDLTVPITELSIGDWDRILATNLRGPFILSKLAWPWLAARRGQIVNIVSTAAKRAWANASAYHASKWGLLGFSHALHVEGRSAGIKVTAVVAGGMRTPFLFERFPDLDPNVLQDPQHVAEVVRSVLTLPDETVIPEVMVLPMRETSWP